MISRLRLLLWIGVAVLLLPFFGIRESLRSWLLALCGAILIYLACSLRHIYRASKRTPQNQNEQVSISHPL